MSKTKLDPKNPKHKGLIELQKEAPGVVSGMGYMKKGGSRKDMKLLLKLGGDVDEIMMASMEDKMRKGGSAKRVASFASAGSKMQEYKMGGWTHSGPKKKGKRGRRK